MRLDVFNGWSIETACIFVPISAKNREFRSKLTVKTKIKVNIFCNCVRTLVFIFLFTVNFDRNSRFLVETNSEIQVVSINGPLKRQGTFAYSETYTVFMWEVCVILSVFASKSDIIWFVISQQLSHANPLKWI